MVSCLEMARQRRSRFEPKELGFQGGSEESSSLNHELRGLNSQSAAHKRIMGHSDSRAGSTKYIKKLMKVSTQMATREQRRNLRELLRVELNTVLGLSSKLEARELQLRSQRKKAEMHPYLSDAEFSRVGPDEGVHEADSATTSADFPWTEKEPRISKHQHCAENGAILTDGEMSFCMDTLSSNRQMHKTALSKHISKSYKRASKASKTEDLTTDGSASKSKLGVLSNETGSEISACHAILNKLMRHKYGWVFNEPVDVVALGLRDYHRVVQRPMDLGTIKSNLNSNLYNSAELFASDVRLTFSNAMLYNPQGHEVYKMAEKLLQLFEIYWKPISDKLEHRTDDDDEERQSGQGSYKAEGQNGESVLGIGPKKQMSYLEKAFLVENVQLLPAPMQDDVIRLMTEKNPDLDKQVDEMEVDIDSLSDETLWELDQYVKECLKMAGINVKSPAQDNQKLTGHSRFDHDKTKKKQGVRNYHTSCSSNHAEKLFSTTHQREGQWHDSNNAGIYSYVAAASVEHKRNTVQK